MCHTSTHTQDLCVYCRQALPWIDQNNACSLCQSFLVNKEGRYCGQCQQKPPPWSKLIGALEFNAYSQWLIHHFKYRENLIIGQLLSRCLLEAVTACYDESNLPEVIMPVPLYYRRLMHRGFNQSAVIGRYLAKHLGLAFDLRQLLRTKHTEPQAKLPLQQRRRNIKGAFRMRACPYQKVAIVDDVLTTGSTLDELTVCLQKAGVKEVDVWCVAVAGRN